MVRNHTINPTTQELEPRRYYCPGCGHEAEYIGDNEWLMTDFQGKGTSSWVCPTLADHICDHEAFIENDITMDEAILLYAQRT